jgi:phytoene dehydrogenase-like protein
VPTRSVSVAILGGGPAGLAAGWRLARRGLTDFALLELEPSVGGTSVAGRSEVTPFPWAAHYLPVPKARHTDLIGLLHEMNALEGRDRHDDPVGAEHLLVRAPEDRLFLDGYWHEGLYPHAGATDQDRAELARFYSIVQRYAALRDGQGRRAFTLPVADCSDDAALVALDRLSAADWLASQGFRSPRLRWFTEYACRDDYGLTLEHTSAWAMLWYYAARVGDHGEESSFLTWPAGNGALVEHLAGATRRQTTTGRMVVDVEPRSDEVIIHAVDTTTGASETLRARHAICAMPRFVARRVVRPLRDRGGALDDFAYGAWMVANLHLRARPFERGFPPAWDNVLYDSASLGYVSATHQRGRDVGPTVWTYYLPLTDEDPRVARQRLLELTWAEWREVIVRDLRRAHPDLEQHLERIDVWRWGHAMIQPRVGAMFSPARRAATVPDGRVHYAHSDLSGVAVFEEAFHHGVQAADAVFDALRGADSVPAEVTAT